MEMIRTNISCGVFPDGGGSLDLRYEGMAYSSLSSLFFTLMTSPNCPAKRESRNLAEA